MPDDNADGPQPQGKQNCCMKIINYFMCHSNDPDTPKKSWGRKCIDCLKPEAEDQQVVAGDVPQRESWGNRCQFFVATLGMSVGLGSVWRFPTLTYKMGGAAFMLIYSAIIMLIGNALFFFEVTNGQYTSKNPLRVFDKVPLFQGIGFAMIAYSYCFCTYYIHMVSFAFYYLFSSFQSPLPWTYCPDELSGNPDTTSCVPYMDALGYKVHGIVCGDASIKYNVSIFCSNQTYQTMKLQECCAGVNISAAECLSKGPMDVKKACGPTEYPSAYYWSHTVVQDYRPDDPMYGYLGALNGYLVGTTLLSWLVCYLGLYKGLRSLGVMMYIIVPLPYLILIIMFIAAIIQEGAAEGLKELFIPKPESFIDIEVWRTATEQAFYSVGVAMGPVITFGSYQAFNSPSHIDGVLICLCIVITGILCSLVVFSALGFLSTKTGRPFSEVVQSGPGLVFIVYPESLELLPGSAFFAVIFYLMLIFLGASSVTGIIETVSSAVYDIWPPTRKYKYLVNLFVTLSSFFCGIAITARGGLSVYNAFDTYAAGMTLIPICALELIVIVFIYGLGRFCEDISFMLGFYPNRYYRYMWMLSPFMLLAIFIYGLVMFTSPPGWHVWTHILSWFLFFCVIGWIPITMIAQMIRFGKRHEFKQVCKPPPDHGPAKEERREARLEYSIKRKIF